MPTEQMPTEQMPTEQIPMIPSPSKEPMEEKHEASTPSFDPPSPRLLRAGGAFTAELDEASRTSGDTSAEGSPKAPEGAPEPVQDEPIVIPEEPVKAEKPTGIDTVSLENPQGNWLYKRIWWERAEERYEKIRLLVDAIWESRTVFFVKRNELDRNALDPFYLNVGIGQGELQTILSEMVEFFEKHREAQGDLSEQERTLYETIAPQEEALKQLMRDVESIANLDHAIDDALGTLMNQINRVRQFERQAWDNFKEIAHILNDTKARELYYMIEGAARNIKNISTYLERDFLSHFNKLIGEATQHVTRVQNQIEALKEQGVNFKRQTELLEQQKEQAQQQAEDEEEEVAPKPKLGWFAWIMSGFTNVFNVVFSIIRLPYDMIFGK